ncbi:MAG: acetylxylan esterase [Kiritimatiellia bacterium]
MNIRSWVPAVLAGLVVSSASAADLKDVRLKARTDKANPIDYRVGEPIRFDFFLDGVQELPAGLTPPLRVHWTRTGDDQITETGTNTISLAEGFSLTTALKVPGFVRYQARLVGADGNTAEAAASNPQDIRFDGGAGAETEKMKLTTVEPADFDAFWQEAKAKLATVPVKATLTEVTPGNLKGRFHVYGIAIDCFGPRPATGWLTIPANAQPGSLKAVCRFDGYNGNSFGVPQPPHWGNAWAMVLHINAHGYEMTGKDAAYYKAFGNAVNGIGEGQTRRATYGLEPSDYDNPRETYFYYMALRVMRAFDYVRSRPEWNGRDLEAEGGSQGGLQAMWAAGLVEGLTAARPSITWGCDIGNSCGGSRFLSNGWGIPHVPGAFYFDAALHGRRVPATCTVEIMRLGLGDYTCPPRGVMLSYYEMKCPVKAHLVQGSTHGYCPPPPNQTFTIRK